MKVCTKCGVEKALAEFYKRTRSKDGHNAQCKSCAANYTRSRRAADPEKFRKRVRDWLAKNRVQARDKNKRYREENAEHLRETARQWHLDNPERTQENGKRYREEHAETIREKRRKWVLENPEKNRAQSARYRASKIRRTPVWSERKHIEQVYIHCPEGYHVDHDIPLQGKTISGLHVLDNLQWLPASENLSKGNTF